MTDNFVGFAQSPKPDPLREVRTLSFDFESRGEIRFAIQLFSSEAGLSSWLGKIVKFDFRQGAKLRYGDEAYGATFGLIQIPKRFVLVAETLGEVDVKIREQKVGYQLTLTVKRAVRSDELNAWEQDVNRVAAVFGAVANG